MPYMEKELPLAVEVNKKRTERFVMGARPPTEATGDPGHEGVIFDAVVLAEKSESYQ